MWLCHHGRHTTYYWFRTLFQMFAFATSKLVIVSDSDILLCTEICVDTAQRSLVGYIVSVHTIFRMSMHSRIE